MRRMNSRRKERGATMIEMAIAGSALIIGIFGLIESRTIALDAQRLD
ncbi:MAG: type IV pilus modification PilV family protein [Blastocatellia bacterium]